MAWVGDAFEHRFQLAGAAARALGWLVARVAPALASAAVRVVRAGHAFAGIGIASPRRGRLAVLAGLAGRAIGVRNLSVAARLAARLATANLVRPALVHTLGLAAGNPALPAVLASAAGIKQLGQVDAVHDAEPTDVIVHWDAAAKMDETQPHIGNDCSHSSLNRLRQPVEIRLPGALGSSIVPHQPRARRAGRGRGLRRSPRCC